MELTQEIKESIEKCILCWLATSSADHRPNVSPKEVFAAFGSDSIIIANIASPQTVKNIWQNQNVCVSFVDIMVQKGYQLKGSADIVTKTNKEYPQMEKILLEISKGDFPFTTITRIKIESAKPIIAPRYLLYPETTEEQQILSARELYGF